jgi:hypothetical protein
VERITGHLANLDFYMLTWYIMRPSSPEAFIMFCRFRVEVEFSVALLSLMQQNRIHSQ